MHTGLTILYEDLCPEWVRLCAGAGIDSLCVHKLETPGSDSIGDLLRQLDAPDGRRNIELLNDAGIDTPYELHALEYLLPRRHFADHPDWFRINESGIRTADLNLCASSTEALDELSDNTYRLAKALRQPGHRYHLWLDDAATGICSCPACRSKNGSDQYLAILSAMLRGLRAYDSDAEISFLSYGAVLDVPTVKPEKGIFLEFAPMNRDHNKAMTDPAHEQGKSYLALLDRLLEIFAADEAEVLEYWLDDALYSGYKRPPAKVPFNAAVCAADAGYYRSRGITTIRSFGSFMGEDYFGLYGDPPVREYGEIVRGRY